MDPQVHFFCEDVTFSVPEAEKVQSWLAQVSRSEGFSIKSINYIFCSDEYLHTINIKYLNHDFYTDIITFDQSETEGEIEGDIFISVERVEDNAHEQKLIFQEELLRVMVHGMLHLIGFDDKSDTEREQMRKKEDSCLSLYSNC